MLTFFVWFGNQGGTVNTPMTAPPSATNSSSKRNAFPHMLFIVFFSCIILISVVVAANFMYLAARRSMEGSELMAQTWIVAACLFVFTIALGVSAAYASRALAIKEPFFYEQTSAPRQPRPYDATSALKSPLALLRLQ